MKEEEINGALESVAPHLDALTPAFKWLEEHGVDAGFVMVGGAELSRDDKEFLYRTIIHCGGSHEAIECAFLDACDKLPGLFDILVRVVAKGAKKHAKGAMVIPFVPQHNKLKN